VDRNSFIFSFRYFPHSFIGGLIVVALLEIFLFSRAHLLADRSTVCIVHKSQMIKKTKGPDIVLFGASRALAINAKKIEESTGGKFTVYNYALPHLGTTLQFYLTLKKYLEHNNRPRLIILSAPPEMFGVVDKEGIFRDDPRGEMNRFRRFFSALFLLQNVQFKEKWGLLREYINNIIPSFNYRTFVSDSTISSAKNRGLKRISFLIKRNSDIIRHLEETNGQMVYNADRVVSREERLKRLPETEESDFSILNIGVARNIEKFIALADDNNIPTVLFFMPLLSDRYSRMEEMGYFKEITRVLQEYQKKYSSFRYYDSAPLTYGREYFGDWSHLNQKGVERFNREFINCFQDML